MNSYKRAVRAVTVTVVVTAVVASGSGIATASAAEAHPAHARTAVGQDLLGLPLVELIPLELPVLSGLGEIGSLLSVSNPAWNLLGVTNNIVWLQDGIPIPGTEDLWSYIPTEFDGGHEISALVTGSLLGVLPVELLTNTLGISLPGAEATTPTATTPATITGTPKVDNLLTATAPTWSTDGVTNTYQWQRTGVAIPGATASTYTVTPTDVAKAISVKVTGTKPAFSPGVATSAPVTGIIGDAPTASTPPSISGTHGIGDPLHVNTGSWGAGTLSFTYQWLRNASAIPGATGSDYVTQTDDAAKTLTVAVTATRPGHTPGAATTSGIHIAKLTSTTKAALIKKKIRRGARGLLRITLRSNGATPSGAIRVLDGTKLIKTYAIRGADNGQRTFKLPKLKPGKHQLKATFKGNSSTNASTSRVVTLTVLKKK